MVAASLEETTKQERTMEHQDCGSYRQLLTNCAGCGAPLPNGLNRIYCLKCQARGPVSTRVTMNFEMVEVGDGEQGVKVSAGNAGKTLRGDDFATPAQLWNRVGEIVRHALVWGHAPDNVEQAEAEWNAAIDAERFAEAGPEADPASLLGLPEL
jgi:hypothetical protein